MKKIFALGVFFLLMKCNSASNHDQNSNDATANVDRNPLEAVLKAYYDDMSDRNWTAYRSHFWKNATITTVWQTPNDSVSRVHVITVDEFIAQTPNGPDSKPIFEERMKSMKVDMQGDLAVVWADYEAKFGTEDSLMTWTGTDLFSMLRQNDEWKIVSLTFEADH